MPGEPKAHDRQALLTAKADSAILRTFPELANYLGFDSPEISNNSGSIHQFGTKGLRDRAFHS